MNYTQLKQEIFSYFHSNLTVIARSIQVQNIPHGGKSILINQAVERVKNDLANMLAIKYSHLDRSKLFMLLQYCYSVMSFEYRNVVWPYEYMAFSRRNGELWERFCKAAWDNSQLSNLHRISAPSFHEVRNSFRDRIINYTQGNQYQHHIVSDVDSVFELVGEINMIADEMFNLNGRNHIIDFKSGFGSNEKGNTLRLIAVGRAYKHWDPNVNLLFLVRQNENNNYLETIRRSNLWEVHCGDAAYRKIDELTNAGICEIRREAIDFRNDLSPNFWNYLINNNLSHYLDW
ncbi:hypothetical protein GCM10027361_12800 [Erwinia aphidicola]|uniref:hypothetical protein n=1 Tax=Erwinia aphidicola TaxID=68334 RepID=UPI0017475F75|nr:hypothetical protein [Erwinia aphidicola]MBD1374038.1 hypothetical protein [Erwinia aphidicola]